MMVLETDYAFGPGDIVRIFFVVTETGKISIPEVGVIQVEGLTESQLEEELRQILEPGILKEPAVRVTLLNSQKRTYSISGQGVPVPGRYTIPRYDFRLLDALATAGGISQFNISYVFVSRSVTGGEERLLPLEPEGTQPERPTEGLTVPERKMLETIAPWAGRQLPANKVVIASAEMVTNGELAAVAVPEGFRRPTAYGVPHLAGEEGIAGTSGERLDRQKMDESVSEEKKARIEWIFQDGRWVPVQVDRPVFAEPTTKPEPERVPEPLREEMPADFGWDEIGRGGVQTRVIKIPADKLATGDPRYNVVIRPGDSIQVPVDIIGEFSIMGNVNRQGFVNVTGRPMTLMQAIAAAGGLGPLAWPKRCEVRRRLGKNREEIVMVDLDKIASGEQPDFFIKPNDLINVGTHPTSIWRAVLRNAFRATYGFGFVYDRNFADRDFGTRRPIPDIF
jgi:polysaccharide export outer membrane protein